LDWGYALAQGNGRALRAAYILKGALIPRLLGDHAPGDLWLYSDSGDGGRTIMSGQATVSTLFPEVPRQEVTDVVPWHTSDVRLVTGPNELCPRGYSVNKAAEDALGTWKDIHLQECWQTALCNGLMPSSTNLDEVRAALKHADEWLCGLYSFKAPGETRPAGAFVLAPLLRRMRQNLLETMDGSKKAPKFVLWSGHDTTIAPLLAIFGHCKGWPPYSSMLNLELYSGQHGDYFVRLLFQTKPLLLAACGHKEVCPVKEFLELLDAMIPSDEECAEPLPTKAGGALPTEATDNMDVRQLHSEVGPCGSAKTASEPGLVRSVLPCAFSFLVGALVSWAACYKLLRRPHTATVLAESLPVTKGVDTNYGAMQ